jgi:membrane associated rhomboid family serine protease
VIPLHDNIPTNRFPFFTIGLIFICILVFLWQVSLSPESQQNAIYALGAVPALLFDKNSIFGNNTFIPPSWTLVTSMFLHGGWMHLLGNMLYLWIFGNNIEDVLGHKRFLAFYILAGLIAALSHALPNPASTLPMIGASGAISGILGAYLLLFPKAKVLVLIPLGFIAPIVRIPALLVLGAWFLIQIISSLLSDSTGGGVAWGAHVGGFVAGIILLPFFRIGLKKKRSRKAAT